MGRKLALHWKIIIGMVLGIAFGMLAAMMGWGSFSVNWIKPFGTVFINLLKLIAVPLIISSLVIGVASLKDISKLSKLGGKTIVFYLFTTVIAISIGLTLVNLVQPGLSFPEEQRNLFREMYAGKTLERTAAAEKVKDAGPLQMIVEMVPDNLISAMSANTRMLQVIFFSIFFGIGMISLPESKTLAVKAFFENINDIILKMVDLIMLGAPYGVFALMASLITDFAGDDPSIILSLLSALSMYSLTVVGGLLIMVLLVYPLMLKLFTNRNIRHFYSHIVPAQMLAFSTSSSAATLPVSMEIAEKDLKIPEETSSFVLPLGATINMDGTSLYQAVAAVFIAQAFGIDLSLSAQLGIIATATLASIGAAPVPGAGMVMLVIILQSVGLQPEGLALIFAVDRLLDMCRTVVNVTSDLTAASVIAGKQND